MEKIIRKLNENFEAVSKSLINEGVEDDMYINLYASDFEDPKYVREEIEEISITTDVDDIDSYPDIDIAHMTAEELLSNMSGNVSEKELDNMIKQLKKIAKVFDMKVYEEIIVAVDDGSYNPQYVLSEGIIVPELGMNMRYYPEAKIVSEIYNGVLYLYFATEAACKKYFKLANKFLTNFEIDEACFNKSASANYLKEDKIDIHKALNHRDNMNGNKFNLLNKYLGESYTDSQKMQLVKLLLEEVTDEEIYNYMQEIHADEDSMKDSYDDVEDDEDLRMWKDMSEEDLRRIGAFDNLNDEEVIDDEFDWELED